MNGSSAPSAVVDTNIFASGAIHPLGHPRQVIRAWYEGRFELLVSDEQRAELMGVLGRRGLTQRFRESAAGLAELGARLTGATTAHRASSIPVSVGDPKDEHILAAAMGGVADYLVTGDQDLLVLQGDPRLGDLRIVTAAQFLAVLEGSENQSGATL